MPMFKKGDEIPSHLVKVGPGFTAVFGKDVACIGNIVMSQEEGSFIVIRQKPGEMACSKETYVEINAHMVAKDAGKRDYNNICFSGPDGYAFSALNRLFK